MSINMLIDFSFLTSCVIIIYISSGAAYSVD